MPMHGIRGAITIPEDRPEDLLAGTRRLLQALLEANPSLKTTDLASAFFTTTADLVSAYPARAARQCGWEAVPLMCSQEIPVPSGLPRCVRVLLLWNTELSQADIHHVYLEGAAQLRPDLSGDRSHTPSNDSTDENRKKTL